MIRVSLLTSETAPFSIDSEMKPARGGADRVSGALEEMYRTALPAETIARAMAYAIEQPPEVDVKEIVVRPAVQAF